MNLADFIGQANSRSAGMTLVEVVLVVALLGLLLSIAMPTYQGYLERAHRVEAIRLLLTAAACQERHRARSGVFDTTRCAGSSDNEFYRLNIEPAGQTSSSEFVLIAEPLARQHSFPSIEACRSLISRVTEMVFLLNYYECGRIIARRAIFRQYSLKYYPSGTLKGGITAAEMARVHLDSGLIGALSRSKCSDTPTFGLINIGKMRIIDPFMACMLYSHRYGITH